MEASTSPSTVTTYARLRVMVREGCAEAVLPGKSARTKAARRLAPTSPVIRKYTTINYASSSAVSNKSYQYGKYKIDTS